MTAAALCVGKTTVDRWADRHPEFGRALLIEQTKVKLSYLEKEINAGLRQVKRLEAGKRRE